MGEMTINYYNKEKRLLCHEYIHKSAFVLRIFKMLKRGKDNLDELGFVNFIFATQFHYIKNCLRDFSSDKSWLFH
jgi:hypothetical protein